MHEIGKATKKLAESLILICALLKVFLKCSLERAFVYYV